MGWAKPAQNARRSTCSGFEKAELDFSCSQKMHLGMRLTSSACMLPETRRPKTRQPLPRKERGPAARVEADDPDLRPRRGPADADAHELARCSPLVQRNVKGHFVFGRAKNLQRNDG